MAAQRLCAAFQRGLAPLASTRTFFSSAQLRTVQSVAETPDTATTSAPSSSPGPLFTLLSERITGPHTVALKPVFAVVELAGTQYKVTPNDTIVTEKLSGVDVSEIISLDRVLLAGTANETIIGRPTVPGITVTAAVEVERRLRIGDWGVGCFPYIARAGCDACRLVSESNGILTISSTHHCRSNSWTARC